ncbi:MAG TPA: tRNA pseudouridine(55) synthase TruB [Pseudogracilibacillus sp.]|nr:tRNA pseudouridine(55) synthase TruB [Pseudogracilibacillus sp.]
MNRNGATGGQDRLHGIIPLRKEVGVTSFDCVRKIRHLLQVKKVGHSGTLDPDVEGVLPICIGEATKVIPFLQQHKKTYEAEVHLGTATTTEDRTGDVIEKEEVTRHPSAEKIDRVLHSFNGTIVQVPPMYSAVKVKGKRLYEYARAGIEVERPQREVTIHSICRLNEYDEKTNTFRFRVTCSKGTYIRTLCVDIGKQLGFPAHMSFLQRTESDSFHLKETVTMADVKEAVERNNVEHVLQPIERSLTHLDSFHVSEETKRKVLYGQKLPRPPQSFKTDEVVLLFRRQLLAIYTVRQNDLKPVRVFNIQNV